jgi:hypothetical protein
VNTAALTQATLFAEQVNLLSGSPSTPNIFSIGNESAIVSTKVPACGTSEVAKKVPLSQTTFCVIQMNTGLPGSDTGNDTQYKGPTYADCRKTGAQFVGINIFDQDTGSKTLGDFLDTNLFGTYSFQRVGI